jgi:hypothetical protein
MRIQIRIQLFISVRIRIWIQEAKKQFGSRQETLGLFVNFGQFLYSRIWIRIPKTDPDPGQQNECGTGSTTLLKLDSSVVDPDASDPYVFGPPGSGSFSQRAGSGSVSQRSGSFYHQAKIVRKPFIPTVF